MRHYRLCSWDRKKWKTACGKMGERSMEWTWLRGEVTCQDCNKELDKLFSKEKKDDNK